MKDNPLLEIGYINRAHGTTGEVGVKTFDPQSEALFEVERLVLKLKDGNSRKAQIESVRATPKDTLLMLKGVRGRLPAEALVGSTVFVYREDLGELGEGEYFQGDLVGMRAVDEAGAELGEVAEVWNTGPVPNLVIRSADKPELIIPFIDEFVPLVDTERNTVVIRPLQFKE